MESISPLYAARNASSDAEASPSLPTHSTSSFGWAIIAAVAADISEPSAGYFMTQDERLSMGMVPAVLPQTCVFALPPESIP